MNTIKETRGVGATCDVAAWMTAGLMLLMAGGEIQAQSQALGLDRHGPISASHGFPEWYQDATGLALEVGVPKSVPELNGGWLLLLPADAVYPEVFPGQFGAEHFYWTASASGNMRTTAGTTTVVFGMAHEAAFSTGEAAPGAQVVFTRTRLDVRSAPFSGTYVLETPYKTYEIPNQVAGQRIRLVEDIGVGVAPEGFELSLKTPIAPYLVPASSPGGPELPPVLFEGRSYIADPAQTYFVTGSPLNRNLLRLKGPGGQVLFETDRFNLTGRVRTTPLEGGMSLVRASRFDDGTNRRVDVFACGNPTLQPRLPGQPILGRTMATADVFLGGPTTNAQRVVSIPAGRTGVRFQTNEVGVCYYTSIPVTGEFPTEVSSRDQYGFIQKVPVEAMLSVLRADYSLQDKTLTVEAASGEFGAVLQLQVMGVDGLTSQSATFTERIVVPNVQAPPTSVRVVSAVGGSVTAPVTVGLPALGTGFGGTLQNQPPIASQDEFIVTLGVPADLDVLGNDVDVDADALVIVSVSQPVVGGVPQAVVTPLNGGRSVRYEPLAGGNANQLFSYAVSDGRGGSSSAQVRVRVNLPPVAEADTVFATDAEPTLINVLANDSDADGGVLTLVRATGSAAVEVSMTQGQVLYRALPAASAVESLTYVISDSQGGFATNRVFVTRNHAPVATSETLYGLVGATSRVDVLANDTDADGDGLVITSVVPPAVGTATISADGRTLEFSYGSVTAPPTVVVGYTVSDGKGGTASAQVTLLPNRAPVAVADAVTQTVNEWNTFAALSNDTDADGDTLRVVDVRATTGVTVQIPAGGRAVEFEVLAGAAGTLPVVTYTVSDGKGGVATSTITVNQPPTAGPDAVSMCIGEVKSVVLTSNDTDPNGDALVLSNVQAPAGLGVLSIVSGPLARTAIQITALSAGSHLINYTVSDGRGGTAPGVVQVTVQEAVNRNPIAVKDTCVGQSGEAVALTPLVNDTDPDGDALRVGSVTQPTQGTLTVDADGQRVWFTANQGASLIDQTVTYTVVDARGATSTALVTLTARDQVTVSQALCTGLRTWSLRGTAAPGAVVEVYNGAALLRRVTASSTGAWAASVVSAVPAPVNSVRVTSSRGGSLVAPVTNR